MKLYTIIQSIDENKEMTVNRHSVLEASIKLYLKLKKKGKTHRSVIDRNRSDVNEIENTHKIGDINIGVSNRSDNIKSEIVGLLVKKMNCM